MMDGWRRQRSDNHNHEVARTRSQNRKPPLGSWQPTVPSWEKKFCAVVGSVPWQQLLENKKFIHLFNNILEWNDSAGEEAFINAKNRFWAQINGLPCHISSPDPDIYIDKIDWNSNTDPDLILDLECESVAPTNQEKGEQVVIIGELFVRNDLYSSIGWGDVERTGLRSENNGNSWQDDRTQAKEPVRQKEWGNVCNDSWCGNQDTGVAKNSGWEDGWNQWEENNNKVSDWNQWEENNNKESDNLYARNAGLCVPCNANHWNQENTGGYVSR